MKIKSKLLYVFSLSFLLILIGGLHLYFGGSSVSSQEATEQETREIVIKPAGKIRVRRAKIRTPEDMARAEVELRSMPFEELEVPFMPTMDLSEYLRLKEEANSGVATEGATESPAPELELVEPRVAPTLRGVDYNGASQTAADGFPPDTHGAVGTSHFVEAVNRRIIVFDKSNPGVQQCSFALQACFGAAGPVFDPRVVYDPVWNRWVFVATRRSSSPDAAREKKLEPSGLRCHQEKLIGYRYHTPLLSCRFPNRQSMRLLFLVSSELCGNFSL